MTSSPDRPAGMATPDLLGWVRVLPDPGLCDGPSPRGGSPPVLKAWDRRGKWAAISCLTVSPVAGLVIRPARPRRGYGRVAPASWAADGGVGLEPDPQQVEGGQGVVAKHPGVVAEDFPGYVPDLNPNEGVWAVRSTVRRTWLLTAKVRRSFGIMWSLC